MVKTQLNDGTWEYINDKDFLNVTRSLYLQNGKNIVAFPKDTNITMIVDGKYYTYKIPENFEGKLSINLFEDEKENKYVETNNIQGTINLDRLSAYNSSDLGKDIVVRISLIDENNKVVVFPKGTKLIINNQEYGTTTIAKIIENLEQKKYTKDLYIQLDMTNVLSENEKLNGKYTIKFDFYLSKDNILLGKYPIYSNNLEFEINQILGYGLKIVSVNKNADIIAKTYKRQIDGSFIYTDLESTIALEQRITNLTSNIEPNLIFDSTLENGTYKIEYQLLSKNGKEIAKTYINFIVNR